ncbi:MULTISPECIES: hypothetical protein [Haloferax]|uniref:DUF7282 domain-containing protein n=1 Tax=Haloferax TaxID=2251 RepID=UPI0017867D52|nr:MULTISPECIES: hypothetical protein [Haloferax]
MNTRIHIATILFIAAVVTVAATGIGFAAPEGATQAVGGPNSQAVGTQYAQVQQQAQGQQCTYPLNDSLASYDVSNLSAPSTVQPGDTVTVTADITNPNSVPMIQCVEFRLEGDVVERIGWALNPGETETVTFEVSTSGLPEGTYIHGVETQDMGELTTLTVSSEPVPTASVQFDDQTTDGDSVTVTSATLPDGGYIAIIDESGSVLGATEYLEPGDQSNVTVALAEPLTENATLTAQAHVDSNDNQVLDFLTSEGAEDGPYTVDGAPVTDTAAVTVAQAEPEPPAEEPTASVQFDDQTSDGTTVTVTSATLSAGGFIAIHDASGAVVGASEYLEPGDQSNVTVTLAEPLTENATLTAMPHLDTNDNQQLDFLTSEGAEDGPYTMNGAPVTDTANVIVGAAEPTPTATPTATPTTEEPTTEAPTTEEPTTEEPTTEAPPAEEATASVQFNDQSTAGVAVLVASATLSEGGFIVIHDESGAVIGASGYLSAGEQEDIAVTLDEPLTENATLTAMPHFDSNGNEQFDFVSSEGADDGPYTANGAPVTDNAEVTVETNETSSES